MLKRALPIIFAFGLFFVGTISVKAGFGITPPYVRNDALTQNSRYDQRIILTRSDPVEDLNVEVSVNVPEANEWITIDRGMRFIMPKGETQVPMVVSVNVPKKARAGDYAGNIRVVISPAHGPTPGTVGISLGAQIDVRVSVVDRKIFDFVVRSLTIGDLESGHAFWKFFFPGKIRFTMQTENLGNVAYGPTKVVFDIFDNARTKILETTANTNTLARIEPFGIGNVVAELPTRLPPGSYKGVFHIYKENEIVREGELNLSVVPYGTIPGSRGYGIEGLTQGEQVLMAGLTLLALAILGALGWGIRKFVRRRRR